MAEEVSRDRGYRSDSIAVSRDIYMGSPCGVSKIGSAGRAEGGIVSFKGKGS